MVCLRLRLRKGADQSISKGRSSVCRMQGAGRPPKKTSRETKKTFKATKKTFNISKEIFKGRSSVCSVARGRH